MTEEQAPPGVAPVTKNTLLTPIALNVEKGEINGLKVWMMQFILSPFEVMTVQFTDEAAKALVRELTGGVTVATPGDVAALRQVK